MDTPRTIAVVSGKGGSGKTMAAATLACLLANEGAEVILMDGDVGTAGLSYYLGLKYVRNTRRGFSSFALLAPGKPTAEHLDELARALEPVELSTHSWHSGFQFLAIGDHRRLSRAFGRARRARQLGELFAEAVNYIAPSADTLLIDCRGGIDEESIAICRVVDEIVMIVEPDTTSFQASQHLAEVLSDNDLGHKLRGFIVNKAIQDPTVVARSGGNTLRTQYLGAIPLDIEAARSFLVSEVPDRDSIFAVHLQDAFSKAYPRLLGPPRARVWATDDYNRFNVLAPESTRGGVILAFLIVYVGLVAVAFAVSAQIALTRNLYLVSVITLTVLGAVATQEPLRQLVGRQTEAALSFWRPFRRYSGRPQRHK